MICAIQAWFIIIIIIIIKHYSRTSGAQKRKMSETISSALAVHHRDTNSGSSSRSRMTATARSTTTSFVSLPDDITDEDLDQVQLTPPPPVLMPERRIPCPTTGPSTPKGSTLNVLQINTPSPVITGGTLNIDQHQCKTSTFSFQNCVVNIYQQQ